MRVPARAARFEGSVDDSLRHGHTPDVNATTRVGGRGSAGERLALRQVLAFRLHRQQLASRAPAGTAVDVLAAMAGAQAQLESAAAVSLWARIEALERTAVAARLWTDRAVAKAACMRRTLHLVPARALAEFVRGTAGRAHKEVRWMRNKGVSERDLGRAVDAALDAMQRPLTRPELAESVGAALGLAPGWQAGGGWGSTRDVPSVRIGPVDTPAHYLLHLVSASGVVCYGPPRGNQPTFVRADTWLAGWRDMAPAEAEDALLRRYLRAFGPATAADFAAWAGLRVTDARAVWARAEAELLAVELDGRAAWILAADLGALRGAEVERPHVRLLPYFDAYLLGHAERSAFVPEGRAADVYRKQGWVAPVLLVDGRAQGTWLQKRKAGRLELHVTPFGPLSRAIVRGVEREAEALARFFGSGAADVRIDA